MTLQDLFEALKALPGHEALVMEDYRLTMEVDDPGQEAELHFYLTGPGTFYLYLTHIGQGEERTLAEYSRDALDEAVMRG